MKPQTPTKTSQPHYDPLAATTPEQWAKAMQEREAEQQGPPELMPDGHRQYFEAVSKNPEADPKHRAMAKGLLQQDKAKRAAKTKAA